MAESKIIKTEDLMELAAIDGDYNLPRVKAWQEAAEAEIISFTGFNINTATYKEEDVSGFIAVAKLYLQERVREMFLAPNYENTRGIDSLKIRLSLIVDEIDYKEEKPEPPAAPLMWGEAAIFSWGEVSNIDWERA
jgi:hypothetical protein